MTRSASATSAAASVSPYRSGVTFLPDFFDPFFEPVGSFAAESADEPNNSTIGTPALRAAARAGG